MLKLAVSLRRGHKFKSFIGCKSESNTAIEYRQSAGRLRLAHANSNPASAIGTAPSKNLNLRLRELSGALWKEQAVQEWPSRQITEMQSARVPRLIPKRSARSVKTPRGQVIRRRQGVSKNTEKKRR